MKRCAWLLIFGLVSSIGTSAFADESRAVNISIGSSGGPLDEAALRVVRQVVGHAVANSTVGTFTVNSPKKGSPIPIEGGLSACAEAGFNIKNSKFNAFIQDLRSIHPKRGTFYKVERTASCDSDEITFCPQDVKVCPDGSYVSRTGPSCVFAPCPGLTMQPN